MTPDLFFLVMERKTKHLQPIHVSLRICKSLMIFTYVVLCSVTVVEQMQMLIEESWQGIYQL